MRGPKWKFENVADFHRAVEICKQKVPADSWRVTDDNTITFASMRAEELYSIAKAVAGLSSSATRPTEGQLQWSK